MTDLHRLRFVAVADVYKAGRLAGRLERTGDAGTAFRYDPAYLEVGHPPVAVTLPLTGDPVAAPSGGVPPFFAGLLPEGHRLTVLKDAVKTSLDDELSLLLAVGADAPGDVQIVPSGEPPIEPEPLAGFTKPQELDFTVLAAAVDLHALPGVQDKASASMLTAPLATRGSRLILKLDPPRHPHLVENEALHLAAARRLRIPVAEGAVVVDRHGRPGLLVERFDRVHDGDAWVRLPLEDAAQVMGLAPAAKYTVNSEEVVRALSAVCKAPVVAARNLYLQFVFAWLTGNGDLHAKNVSVLGGPRRGFAVAPVYDVPCTLLYDDDSQALPVDGRVKNLRPRHWAAFADAIGLPERAAQAANTLALRAAAAVDLRALPFEGSPLNRAERELRYRRAQLET
ncbi:HipA domain-containing protein [Kocuria sp. LUK]|uniref:type II toxin-antitoxin system HipA family toxin n=1 Tax=Kocuria sp. LUK TaxID=2897828 RepID=UPI001E4FF356|nr:HipA domain-containing protein [Kocuria sp. LUK]MCD1144581.1 HipA domain-containing protein [Kocuria sp. LUK]